MNIWLGVAYKKTSNEVIKNLKTERWKKILGKRKQDKAKVLHFILEKVIFKVKSTEENTEGHYTKIEGAIYEEDIKVIKLHAPGR